MEHFFIRDAFQFSGKASSLNSSQEFWGRLVTKIDEFCASPEAGCKPIQKSGVIMGFDSRWLPYFEFELLASFRQMVAPEITLPTASGDRTSDSNVLRAYRKVTPKSVIKSSGNETPQGAFREILYAFYELAGPILSCLGLLGILWASLGKTGSKIATLIGLLFASVILSRLTGLAFAAVTMGTLDDRLYFNLHVMNVVVCVCALVIAVERFCYQRGVKVEA